MIQTHNPKSYKKQKFYPCYTAQESQKHNSETVVPWNISGNTQGQKLNVYMTMAGPILWPYSCTSMCSGKNINSLQNKCGNTVYGSTVSAHPLLFL